MKKNYFLRLALLLFAVTLGQSVKAEGEDPVLGLEQVDGVYQINNIGEWYALVDYVREGGDTQGKTFKLMSDIAGETDDEIITEPIGCQKEKGNKNSRMRFAGTFDGDGHTINVRLESYDNDDNPNPNYCAPFAYCKNATIKNLKVTGSIYTEGTFAGGLVGQSGPDGDKTNGKITIDKVEVAVEMNCNYLSGGQGSNRYANQGGFVGIAEGSATITNSWFSGKLTGADFAYSAGFIALNKATSSISNCLFAPTTVAASNLYGSSEFYHKNGGNCTLTNCYYTVSFSEPEFAQGKKVVSTHGDDDIFDEIVAADGNTYYIIKHYKSWVDVVNALANPDVNTIPLENDITAGTEDLPLDVTRDVTFNLNGFTIDRALDIVAAKANGYVIKVENGATVTINNGTIRGGHNSGNGGGILNEGTLTLNGVTVTGNYASNGAGVYNNTGTLNVKGDVQVTGNKTGNVYTSSPINVTGALAATASIGVTAATAAAGTIIAVNGEDGSFAVTNFTSDNTTYHVAVYTEGNDEGKAYLSDAAAVEILLANIGDNSSLLNDGTFADVTLNGRNIAAGYWNSLCLPFDVTVAQLKKAIGNSVQVNELSDASFEDGILTIYFSPLVADTKSISAGTPFFVKNAGKSSPKFEGMTIKNVTNDVVSGNVTLHGTYSSTPLAANNPYIRFLGADDTLYYPGTNGFTLGANRAYFEIDSSINVKSFILNFADEDEPTSIETINDVETTNGAIFNLAGQRISKMQKGINIVNGKKILF